jgi:chemotaxis protein methyltransferase CheR
MRWPGFRKVRRQVCKRVNRRLRHLELESLSAYRDYLERHSGEWLVLDQLCRISISRFYRDRRVFDLLRDGVLPQLAEAVLARRNHVIHAWSAGCASGEEVYTLKMIWQLGPQQQFPDISLHITATDADRRLLERARRGCYSRSSVKDVPHEWMPVAFSRLDDEFYVRDLFRGGIDFLRQDVRQEQPDGPFELILCRHLVLTYFDERLQEDILRQMMARLRPDGILVTGKQETPPPTLDGALLPFQPHSGIYRFHSTLGSRTAPA